MKRINHIWLLIIAILAVSSGAFVIHTALSDAQIKSLPIARIVPAALMKSSLPLVRSIEPLPGADKLIQTTKSTNSDWIPDGAAMVNKEVTANARWSDIAPLISKGDIVHIPQGVTLIYDASTSAEISAIVVHGQLRFDPATSTKLVVGTMLVSGNGHLSIEPHRGVRSELMFHGSVDKHSDPGQMLLGLVATGGSVRIRGQVPKVSFIKVLAAQGSSVLHAAHHVDWGVGDEIYLVPSGPSSVDASSWWFNVADIASRRPFPDQGERATIARISGQDIYLDKKLSYAHDGYAADLTRSVVIHSDPLNPGHARGHVMFIGETSVDVEGARFTGLGRTTVANTDDTLFTDSGVATHEGLNERGRYVLHAHHLSLPFVIADNVVDGSPKWGIVNHDGSGAIRDNVVIGAAGAGIVGEDGTETGVVERNLVIGTGGGSGFNDDERFGVTQGKDMGHGGFGYWFRGPFLNVRDNVAAGHFNQSAYLYFVHPQFVRNSLADRPWIPVDLRGKSHADLISREPIREFKDNLADGFFGAAGFEIFYSETSDEISKFTLRLRGASSANGVVGRHIDSLTVADSVIAADASSGHAIVSSPRAGTVLTSETAIQGFNDHQPNF